MKKLPFGLLMLATAYPLAAQETVPKWIVEIPGAIADGTVAKPIPAHDSADPAVLTSRTSRMEVAEAPEIPGLPPVTGTINVTVQKVEDPGLPEPPPPLPPLPPDDPTVVARLQELGEMHAGTQIVFLSGEVHDHRRTLLRIYPNGKADQEVVAWSNLDFNHFGGVATYRVTDGVAGTLHDYGLLMGIGNTSTHRAGESGEGHEGDTDAPVIPELPDLAIGGPAFVVVKGEAGSPGMNTLEQLHDLYRKEGARMDAAYRVREKALAERKAYLLVNPPKPADVTVQFWRKPKAQSSSQTQPEVPSP